MGLRRVDSPWARWVRTRHSCPTRWVSFHLVTPMWSSEASVPWPVPACKDPVAFRGRISDPTRMEWTQSYSLWNPARAGSETAKAWTLPRPPTRSCPALWPTRLSSRASPSARGNHTPPHPPQSHGGAAG